MEFPKDLNDRASEEMSSSSDKVCTDPKEGNDELDTFVPNRIAKVRL